MGDVKRYKRDIRFLFPIYGANERRFYADLKHDIAEYAEKESGDVSYGDLEEEFGSPAGILYDYLAAVDSQYLSKQLARGKWIKRACLVVVFACVISVSVWGAFCYKAYLDFQEALPDHFEENIERDY